MSAFGYMYAFAAKMMAALEPCLDNATFWQGQNLYSTNEIENKASNIDPADGKTLTTPSNPSELSDGNTLAYYRFDDESTVDLYENILLGEWRDSLGNAPALVNNEIQKAERPEWHTRGILFDGQNDYLANNTTYFNKPVMTMYFNIQICKYTQFARIMDAFSVAQLQLILGVTSNVLTFTHGGSTFDNPNAVNGDNVTLIVKMDGVNSFVEINGNRSTGGITPNSNINGISLGAFNASISASNHGEFILKDFIVREGSDSEQTITSIKNYLDARHEFQTNIYNVLHIGNSITKHPIASFWWGEWGMASIRREFDYVHQFQDFIRNEHPDASHIAFNCADWEVNRVTYDTDNFDAYFNTKPDLVIFKLGENVSDDTDLQTQFEALVTKLQTISPSTRVIVSGSFWNTYPAFENVANANNYPFVEIAYLSAFAYNKSFVGDQVFGDDGIFHTVLDGGVGIHPNKFGMTNIAKNLYIEGRSEFAFNVIEYNNSNCLNFNGLSYLNIGTLSRTDNNLDFSAIIGLDSANIDGCIYSEGNDAGNKSIFVGLATPTIKVVTLTDTLGVDHNFDISNTIDYLKTREGRFRLTYDGSDLISYIDGIVFDEHIGINIDLKKGWNYSVVVGWALFASNAFKLSGKISECEIELTGKSYSIPFSEGNGSVVYDKIDGSEYTITDAASSLWDRSELGNHNIRLGFDLWQNNSNSEYLRVPFDINGDSIKTDGDTITGYTWIASCPSGDDILNRSESEFNLTTYGYGIVSVDELINLPDVGSKIFFRSLSDYGIDRIVIYSIAPTGVCRDQTEKFIGNSFFLINNGIYQVANGSYAIT